MARPKSGAPTKLHLNLTVTEQTKVELTYIAAANHQSISELIAEFASREARKTAKRTGTTMPDTEQLTLL